MAERALADLRRIEQFSRSQWGGRKADQYIQLFEDAFDQIRNDPALLRHEDVSADYLLYRVHKYWIVCDVVAGTTYVVTILNTSMDVTTRLSELQPMLASEVQMLRSQFGD